MEFKNELISLRASYMSGKNQIPNLTEDGFGARVGTYANPNDYIIRKIAIVNIHLDGTFSIRDTDRFKNLSHNDIPRYNRTDLIISPFCFLCLIRYENICFRNTFYK